jgi:hypothetical protein
VPEFAERIQELIDRTPSRIQGTVVVDQVYAQYQHEGLDLKHPNGGRAKYLGGPLMEKHLSYMQDLADSVLEGQMPGAMIQTMEDLSTKGVYDNAPVEFADLKASGHPIVETDGGVIYDRPPMVHRLTEEELRAKGELRALGLGN